MDSQAKNLNEKDFDEALSSGCAIIEDTIKSGIVPDKLFATKLVRDTLDKYITENKLSIGEAKALLSLIYMFGGCSAMEAASDFEDLDDEEE